MTKHLSVVITLALIPVCAFAQQDQDYQDYVRVVEFIWDEFSKAKEFEEFRRQQDTEFRAFLREQEEAYREYVEEVERKWNEFVSSTEQQWVDYGEDKDVRSIVNFEEKETPAKKPEEKPEEKPKEELEMEKEKPEERKGQITVEAIVPAGVPDAVDEAKKLIAQQVKKIFSAANEAKRNVLVGQVKTRADEVVTPENVREFVQEEVLPAARVDPEPLKSKDGVERVRVSVAIPMVPEHLKIRAQQYLSSVRRYCDQYREDVPLVMAVIQTESYFNPLAKSHIPAYGLMQIVPKYAGRDAYKHVFKKDKEPEPKFLYVPENNLVLGIAYLHILEDNYFYGIRDPKKREYLTVASYNGGVGRVIKRMLKKYNIREMSPSEVYGALREEMPDETGDYLAKVTARKSNYLAWQ
jgi:membrane-bound lytic murein transglycosylase C